MIIPPKYQSFFLFGPRGSGKTTWLTHIFNKDHVTWINLLDQSMELRLNHKPDQLLDIWKNEKTEWVIIDEVQKIPTILNVVHRGIEEHKIKFALTGSSVRKLRRGGVNLLAGRAIERKLFPFSALELGKDFSLQKALEFGLLPSIWDQNWSDQEVTDYLYSYVNTYLKEEIASEQLVRKLTPFRRLLVAAAGSNSKIINHSAIERDSGVARKQSERHFEILADTLIGFYLEPYHSSIRKRQTKKSKFYFYDTGIVRALKNIAGESLPISTYEYGELFETFLINEFIKLSSYLNKRWKFYYYKTQHEHEIDLIIEKPGGKLILIEIKSFSKLNEDKLKPLIQIKKDLYHESAYVLSNDKSGQELMGIRCLHWLEGLKEIFLI